MFSTIQHSQHHDQYQARLNLKISKLANCYSNKQEAIDSDQLVFHLRNLRLSAHICDKKPRIAIHSNKSNNGSSGCYSNRQGS
ncbi:MAG: hypothetical protein WBB28_13795 [Crinalium sp.]